MVRLIGAGQMRHHQHGLLRKGDVAQGGPLGGLHPQPVHPAVKLDAEGMTRQGFHVGQQLVDRVDHRGKVSLPDHVGVTGHMPRKDTDAGAGTQHAPQLHPLFGEGHEKQLCARCRQGRGHLLHPETIGICLDRRGGIAGGAPIQRAPVGDDGAEVDRERGSGHPGRPLGQDGDAGARLYRPGRAAHAEAV